MEEKFGPGLEPPKEHELDDLRDQDERGEVSIFDMTGADLPGNDSVMPGSESSA